MSAPMSTLLQLPTSSARLPAIALAMSALFTGCGVDETVHSIDTTTTTIETTTTTQTTSGTGGAGGSEPLIRTVEERSPFGNVGATDNLLWDGDFEWTSPFTDQYGWLFGPPYSYAFPSAVIGAECRSGVKCATVAKNKAILGIGVGSSSLGLVVSVYTKIKASACKEVDVALLNIANAQKDVAIPPETDAPDKAGWCHYSATVPSYDKKVYLLVDNNTGDVLLVDDAVVRAQAANAPPPAPPPMGPMPAEQLARHDEARAAIAALRGPHDPPKNPAQRAFEEHLAK